MLWIRLLEPELGAGPARSCAISDLCPPLVALSDGRALLQLGAGLTRSCRPAHSRCARHAGAPRASRQFRPSPAAYVPGTLLQPQRFKRALSSRSTSAVPRSCFPFRYTLFSCLWLPSSSPWLSSFLAGSLRIQLPPPDPNSKPQPETPAKSIARLSNATTTLSAPVLLMLAYRASVLRPPGFPLVPRADCPFRALARSSSAAPVRCSQPIYHCSRRSNGSSRTRTALTIPGRACALGISVFHFYGSFLARIFLGHIFHALHRIRLGGTETSSACLHPSGRTNSNQAISLPPHPWHTRNL